MPFYIVTDTRKEIHLKEAPNPGAALVQVPNHDAVRIAQPHERLKLQEQEKK